MKLKRKIRGLSLFFSSISVLLVSFGLPGNQGMRPNFIIIFVDDMGYGDAGCYGSIIHHTPHIDELAGDGVLFTDFYVSAPVCTPSRASLLTGCYPQRIDMHVNEKSKDEFRAVLTPESPKGLNPDEITIAELLKTKGYQTACIGKWHLGDQEIYYPTNHGFDYFYGILHSHNQGTENCPLAIFEQDDVVEDAVDISMLTKKMTQKAIQYIRKNKDDAFFLYLPHPMPHFPLVASENFRDSSSDGIYGDAIAEIDWSVGLLMRELSDLGIEKNTMLVFTSDNGGEGRGGMVKGGLNYPLRGHKGQTWEGGMRVPCIVKWPQFIPENKVCKEMVTEMDFLPTIAEIVGTDIQKGRIIDGHNILNILQQPETTRSPYEVFYYYDREQLQAVRWKNWKLHLHQPDGRYPAAWSSKLIPFDHPELYNLKKDITESWNVADEYPEIVNKLIKYAERARHDLGDTGRKGNHVREAGYIDTSEVKCMYHVKR